MVKSIKHIIVALLILPVLAGCTVVGQTEQPAETSIELPLDSAQTAGEQPEGDNPQTLHRPLTFLFFSDTQPDPELGDYTGVGEMIKRAVINEEAPELIIFGGDTVNDGGDEFQWHEFWQAISPALDEVTTAAVAGNHDNHALLAGQFDYPAEAPVEPGAGYFYSLTVDSVFFIMLDSNIMGAANKRDVEWLKSEFQSESARQADWRIVVMHHPMWPVTAIPKDIQRAETMREHFLPVFEEYGVDFILCGHQHVYSRTLEMRGDAAAGDGPGIIQFMAASGDKSYYAAGEQNYIAAGGAAPNYLRLSISGPDNTAVAIEGKQPDGDPATGTMCTITAFDGDHRVIDEYQIKK